MPLHGALESQPPSRLLELSWGNGVCSYLPGTRGPCRKGPRSRYIWGSGQGDRTGRRPGLQPVWRPLGTLLGDSSLEELDTRAGNMLSPSSFSAPEDTGLFSVPIPSQFHNRFVCRFLSLDSFTYQFIRNSSRVLCVSIVYPLPVEQPSVVWIERFVFPFTH